MPVIVSARPSAQSQLADIMRLLGSEPELFFEDVVNHMATICSTPIAGVAIEHANRFWINAPGKERGVEIGALADNFFDLLGRQPAIVDNFACPEGVWRGSKVPRAYMTVPLLLGGAFEGVLLIADTQPRSWGRFEADYLARSARLVASHFDARAALAERDSALSDISSYQKALDKFALVSVTDARGVIIRANDRFCDMSGYCREELIGVDHRIINSGHHPRAFFVDMWRTISRGELWRGEICNRARDGSNYWVDSTIVPMFERDGARPATYMSIRFDCTERHVAQARLSAALDELEDERNGLEARVLERTTALESAMRAAEDANAAKSMFLATMSHELRTPLHSIISFVEMVVEDIECGTSEPGQMTQDLGSVATASHHLLSLINGVLDFSKIEAGKMTLHTEPVALTPLLEECVASVRHAAARNGNVVTLISSAEVDNLVTDRLRLKQCLLNLLANAVKFTSHGEITVTASVIAAGAGRGLQVSVADTGIGMTPEAQRRLFEPFYQADSTFSRAAEGTGLGLALTHRIARLLGGALTVDSAPGAGSTFMIRLPLVHARAEAA